MGSVSRDVQSIRLSMYILLLKNEGKLWKKDYSFGSRCWGWVYAQPWVMIELCRFNPVGQLGGFLPRCVCLRFGKGPILKDTSSLETHPQ